MTRVMRPDLMAVDESRIAADAELTKVLEPRVPGVDKRTVLLIRRSFRLCRICDTNGPREHESPSRRARAFRARIPDKGAVRSS